MAGAVTGSRQIRFLELIMKLKQKQVLHIEFFVIWILALAIVLLALDAVSAEKRGQAPLDLLLARTCIAEISFQPDPAECLLMLHINLVNAQNRGRSLHLQTRRFNGYWKSPKQKRSRPWIKYLTDESQPEKWPRNIDWNQYRDRWLMHLEAVRGFIENPGEHPCPLAIDYGAHHERPKARVRRIQCLDGNTKQRYWKMKGTR